MNHVVNLPFLDERVGVKEVFLRAVILRRATYSAAWCAIQEKDGRFRLTDRGTGIYDDRWETFEGIEGETQLVNAEDRLWKRYARGPQLRLAAEVINEPQAAAGALAAIPDHRYDDASGKYVEGPWDDELPE